MHDDAGFHFTCVIVFVFKVVLLVDGLKPVTGTEKHPGEFQSEFADHCLEVIPAVAVQNNELVNSLAVQHLDNVA